MPQLILTLTRACDLRCSYCPTVKEGWPSLSEGEVLRALELFTDRYGGGDVKLFGGEPLLEPALVERVLDEALGRPGVRRVYLSTNGLGLDRAWLTRIAAHPKVILTLSLDGAPADHRRLRRALPGGRDAYGHIIGLLPELLALPRLVVTQTIAPATARRAAENFDHLLGLGFTRFNLLPGYYLPWRPAQLAALERGMAAIGDRFERAWAAGRGLYLRNLFTRAPTPFFNTGLIVDADGSIHPSNVGLSGSLSGTLHRTRLGDLRDPPSPEALARAAAAVPALLERSLPPDILSATRRADAVLTALCRRLLPRFLALRRRRRIACAEGP